MAGRGRIDLQMVANISRYTEPPRLSQGGAEIFICRDQYFVLNSLASLLGGKLDAVTDWMFVLY